MSTEKIGALLLVVGILPFGGSAYRKTEDGNARYVEGLYEEALRAYTEAQVDAPEAPQLYYDIGNVLYRQGEYEGAAEAYTRALLSAPEGLIGPAAYNLGNARYRQQQFDEAVAAYERALRENPDDTDAKRNLEIALRALQEQPRPKSDEQQNDQQSEEQEQKQENESPENPGEKEGEQKEDESTDKPRESRQRQPRAEGEEEPQEMTPEQAARLLDSLDEQEKENLRQMALERLRQGARGREKDW